jgi:hypothetical protein
MGEAGNELCPRERAILRQAGQGRINALATGFMFFRSNPDGTDAQMMSPLDRAAAASLVDRYLLLFDGLRRCREGARSFLATQVSLTDDAKNLLHANTSAVPATRRGTLS